MKEHKQFTLFDFPDPDAAKKWLTVNDGVMGGVSQGSYRITEQQSLIFFGTLSLENNGGFASVRTRPRNLGLHQGDTLVVRLRGDGRDYSLNLYINRPRIAFSYRAGVPTLKDAWIEVRVPLEKFEATSFGRVIPGAGPVTPHEVNALGFMLSDKKAGLFQLEIACIRVERMQNN